MIKLNGTEIEYTLFPDNTSQVWKIPLSLSFFDVVRVEWEFFHEMEIMHLAQLKDLLDAHNIETNLFIKYLPYARQDKPISNETTFALYTFAKILNLMNFKSVRIFDPHSETALKLIHNSRAIYPTDQVWQATQMTNANLYVFPDAGASGRYENIYTFRKGINGEKKRDQITGKILSYRLNGDIPERDKDSILILDDLCDGGATFILLAKELYSQGAREVSLFVTHGIFSKGLRELRKSGIKRIFTADGEVIGNEKDSLKIVPFEGTVRDCRK